MQIRWSIRRDAYRADVEFDGGLAAELVAAVYFRAGAADRAPLLAEARRRFAEELRKALETAPLPPDFAERQANIRAHLAEETERRDEARQALIEARARMERARDSGNNRAQAEATDAAIALQRETTEAEAMVESLQQVWHGLAEEVGEIFAQATRAAVERFRAERRQALDQVAKLAQQALTDATVAEQALVYLTNEPMANAALRAAVEALAPVEA